MTVLRLGVHDDAEESDDDDDDDRDGSFKPDGLDLDDDELAAIEKAVKKKHGSPCKDPSAKKKPKKGKADSFVVTKMGADGKPPVGP